MLFGQGPLSFAHDVVSTLERKHKQRMTSATDKIERRVRAVTDHAVVQFVPEGLQLSMLNISWTTQVGALFMAGRSAEVFAVKACRSSG